MSPDRPVTTHVRFVRHGEVADKHKGTFYGGAEADLSEHGLAASLVLAAELALDPPDHVHTSPLSRARILAEELARRAGCELTVLEAFRELDRGDWTHRTRDAVETDSPGAVARYLGDPEAGNAPGGERESELAARVWGAVDQIVSASPGERLVVVTHGHVIRVIMRRLLGWSAVDSLQRFVSYHTVLETVWLPDGSGRLLSLPPTDMPEALRDTPRARD